MADSPAPNYHFRGEFRWPCSDPVGLDRFLRDVMGVGQSRDLVFGDQPVSLSYELPTGGAVPVYGVDDFELARAQFDRLGYPIIHRTADEFWVHTPGGGLIAVVRG